MKNHLLAGFLLCLFTSISAQVNSDHAIQLVNAFNGYITQSPADNLYIHTDREVYQPGDTIWYKVYITNGLEPWLESESQVIMTELLRPDGSKVSDHMIKPQFRGAAGYYTINSSTTSSQLILRAFTNRFSEDFGSFQKTIQVSQPINDAPTATASKLVEISNINLFPESGDILLNVKNTVGVEVIKEGNPWKGTLRLMANNEKELATFETNKYGLGSFSFVPIAGVNYRLETIENGDKLSSFINEIKTEGSQIQVMNAGDLIKVTVVSNSGSLNGFVLFAHTKGKIIAIADCPDQRQFQFALKKTDLPSGILHLTLFDDKLIPINERLFFVRNPLEIYPATSSTNKPTYKKREEVTIKINLKEDDNTKDAANLSLAVVSKSQYKQQAYNIVSWILLGADLSSSLDEKIDFSNLDLLSDEEIDAILLTQGWRRFAWDEIVNGSYVKPPAPLKGINLEGKVIYIDGKKGVEGQVTFTTTGVSINQYQVETNSEGEFRLDGLDVYEDQTFFVETKEYKPNTKKPYKVKTPTQAILSAESYPSPSFEPLAADSATYIAEEEIISYLDKLNQRIEEVNLAYSNEVIILDEFTVEGERIRGINEAMKTADAMYGKPTSRLITDSMTNIDAARDAFDLLRGRAAGVQVIGNKILIRGVSSLNGATDAAIVVDGIFVDSDQLSTIPASDIYMIDVLRGADAAIYGARGGNGVVLIYTKRGAATARKDADWGINYFTGIGYHAAHEFYARDHNSRFIDPRPDYRKTIHWEPIIITNEYGKAEIKFFNSDETGEFIGIIQGVSVNGLPIYNEIVFEVK